MPTLIDWCDETVNPFVGCTAGCSYCYAEKLHTKRHEAWKAGKWPKALAQYQFPFTTLQFHADRLRIPMKWKNSKRIFLNSVSDIFDPGMNRAALDMTMAMVALCRQHTFLILTKQPKVMNEYFVDPGVSQRVVACMWELMRQQHPTAERIEVRTLWPLDNLHLGVTVTNQADADYRIPLLLQTPAAVRFLSVEPLLGQIDLKKEYLAYKGGGRYPFPGLEDEHRTKLVDLLDGVICGGQTGKAAPPVYPPYVLQLRDQCKEAGTPFFFKGWGEWMPIAPVYEERECADQPGVIDGDWPQSEVDKYEGIGREVIALEPGNHIPYWCKGSQYRVDHQPRGDAWYMVRLGKRRMAPTIAGRECKEFPA